MALTIGVKAPDFKLVDTSMKERTLGEFLGKKTVLAFYPGAYTGVCTKELCQLRDSLANFTGLKAQVVGISVDGPFANKAFADANKLPFPLLSDYTRSTIKNYGGVHEDFAGLKGYSAAKRSVFVLDSKGVVTYAWVSEDPRVEPPYQEITKALESIS
jgi:peroxiredoxin